MKIHRNAGSLLTARAAAWAMAAATPVFHLGPVLAQTTVLPPVVVTASRTEQQLSDTLLHTTVITADMIRNSGQVDLPALLRHEAGIQITQTGGIGGASGLFMRGAATRQTLVLLDGVPINKQDATGTTSIEHLMLSEIDRVEIVRGNVSSVYGSGAVGGVIQIFTRRGSGAPRPTLSLEIGSRSSHRAAASVSGSADGLRYALSASSVGTAGFSAMNPAQNASVNPDADGYRNTSASGMLANQWRAGQEIGIRFSSSDGRFDFDSGFDTSTSVHKGRTRVGMLALYSNNRISDRWQSTLTLSEAADRNSNRYLTAFPTTDRFETRTRQVDWNNEIAVTPGWRATAGATHQRQSLNGDDGYGGLTDTARNAWSAQAGIERSGPDAHSLQVNLRHDDTQRNDSASTGLVGYGYRLSDSVKLIATGSTGFSAPPLGFLYGPYGNPNLRPEHSRSVEAGVQFSMASHLLRVTWFDSRIRDQIEFNAGFNNIRSAANDGVEVSAQSSLSDWSIRSSLTLQDPRNADTGERLRRRAAELASVAASRTDGPWTYGAVVSYTGRRPDGANVSLPSYALAGLSLSYQMDRHWTVFGRIDNLFDERYQTANGYNQLPRAVFAGVRWQQ